MPPFPRYPKVISTAIFPQQKHMTITRLLGHPCSHPEISVNPSWDINYVFTHRCSKNLFVKQKSCFFPKHLSHSFFHTKFLLTFIGNLQWSGSSSLKRSEMFLLKGVKSGGIGGWIFLCEGIKCWAPFKNFKGNSHDSTTKNGWIYVDIMLTC